MSKSKKQSGTWNKIQFKDILFNIIFKYTSNVVTFQIMLGGVREILNSVVLF